MKEGEKHMEMILTTRKAFFEKNRKAKFYLRDSSEENCYLKKWFIHKYRYSQKYFKCML